MTTRPSRADEVRNLGKLAWPLVLGYLGNHMMGVVDTAVVGRLGEVELGAVGLGNSLFFVFAAFGIGGVHGLDPLIAQAVGAGERDAAREYFWQGIWLALLLAIPLLGCNFALEQGLWYSPLDPRTIEETSSYVLARMPSLVPFLLTLSARCFLQAHDITRPYLVSVVAANLVNVPLDWILVFGDDGLVGLGLPEIGFGGYGVAGAGIATTLCSLLQAAIVFRAAAALGVGRVSRRRIDLPVIAASLRVGIPVGLTLLAEIGVFALATLFAGIIGPRSLAAHHIALTLASTTFQVPLGIGVAAAVRVGQAVGASDSERARRSGLTATGLATAFMTLCALLFLAAPRMVAGVLTDQKAVIEAAQPLVFVAAVFQIVDGIQVVMAGALRGAGDTKVPLAVNVLAHIAVGLPVSVLLAFSLGWGATGLWWGLCSGLFVSSVFLTRRFLRLSARPIARIEIRR